LDPWREMKALIKLEAAKIIKLSPHESERDLREFNQPLVGRWESQDSGDWCEFHTEDSFVLGCNRPLYEGIYQVVGGRVLMGIVEPIKTLLFQSMDLEGNKLVLTEYESGLSISLFKHSIVKGSDRDIHIDDDMSIWHRTIRASHSDEVRELHKILQLVENPVSVLVLAGEDEWLNEIKNAYKKEETEINKIIQISKRTEGQDEDDTKDETSTENTSLNDYYNSLLQQKNSSPNELQSLKLAEQFLALGDYRNSITLADECEIHYFTLRRTRFNKEEDEAAKRRIQRNLRLA